MATIVVLVAVFILSAVVYAFQSFTPRRRGFHGGGGGGGISIAPPVGGGGSAGAFTLEASKNEMQVGVSNNTVYFYAKPGANVATVDLTDGNGNVIAEMKDDGLYSESGDDLQNDGVFTAKLEIDVAQENVSYYSASSNGAMSNTEKICVIAPLTAAELSQISEVQYAFSTLRNSNPFKEMTIDGRRAAVLALLDDLTQGKLIKPNSVYDDKLNNVITYYHMCGVMGMERLEDYDYLHAGNVGEGTYKGYTDFSYQQFATMPGVESELPSKQGAQSELPSKQGAQSEPKNNSSVHPKLAITAGDARILYAWGDKSDSGWTEYYDYCVKMKNEWNDLGLNTTLDSNVTLADLKNLDEEKFVYIAAHGGYGTFTYDFEAENKWYHEKTSQQNSVTVPGVVFLEKSTKSKDSEYSLDLKSGRVFICNGEYGIAPAFFDKYYDSDDLEDSIFFWGSCELFGRDGIIREDWTNVLTKKAIKAFVGFHNSNYIFYHYNLLDVLVPDLIEGKTINDALEHAKSVHGANDVAWYNMQGWSGSAHSQAAYPLLRGDSNATLVNLSLKNGNFEASSTNLKNWKKTGDVRLLSRLGDVYPKEGKLMAILTTGIGSGQSSYLDSTEGSSLYQTFKVAEDKATVSFDYNIISEEPHEYVGSKFDDKFYAEILDASGKVIKTIASETVNNSTWTEVNGINFDGGDDTVYQTGWKNVSCDISDLKGQIVTIRFIVFDVGDSLFDTAAVVDNIVLQ